MNETNTLRVHNLKQLKLYQEDLKTISINGRKTSSYGDYIITITREKTGTFCVKILIEKTHRLFDRPYCFNDDFMCYCLETKKTELVKKFIGDKIWIPDYGLNNNNIDAIYISYIEILSYVIQYIIPVISMNLVEDEEPTK